MSCFEKDLEDGVVTNVEFFGYPPSKGGRGWKAVIFEEQGHYFSDKYEGSVEEAYNNAKKVFEMSLETDWDVEVKT